MLEMYEVTLRILGATIVGLILGFTRRHKPPGLRTFGLLCIGTALFTIIGIELAGPGVDNTRIIGQIVSGIGFLGLGVIWKHGEDKPAGLTTASVVWVTAAIGICCGLAFWFEAALSTILAFIIIDSKKYLQQVHLEDG